MFIKMFVINKDQTHTCIVKFIYKQLLYCVLSFSFYCLQQYQDVFSGQNKVVSNKFCASTSASMQ